MNLSRETSPRRAEIRREVHQNIKLNAERMKRQYCKKKRVFEKIFQVCDNVAVMVPKVDRSKVDSRRIPAVIVKIKDSSPRMYKLACNYGTIAGYFSTSSLITYPGTVALGNVDHEIYLREAAKKHSIRNNEIIYCMCKKKCNTNKCPCKKAQTICHSRCHKGKRCENEQENTEDILQTSINYFMFTCIWWKVV